MSSRSQVSRRLLPVVGYSFLIVFVAGWILARGVAGQGDQGETRFDVSVPEIESVRLERSPDGDAFTYRVLYADGQEESLSPEAFSRAIYRLQAERPFWHRLLNITSPLGVAWVALGLLGQVLFSGRMLVQWLASEKAGRSVVPVSFWWMSLGGATMLVVYFVWRKDIVGVLGQSTGWLIYSRNLYLIYRRNTLSLQE